MRQACPGMPSLAGLEYGKRISRERGPSWDPKGPSEFARAAQSTRAADRRWRKLPSIFPGHKGCLAFAASETFLRNIPLRLESDVKNVCFATTTPYICGRYMNVAHIYMYGGHLKNKALFPTDDVENAGLPCLSVLTQVEFVLCLYTFLVTNWP